MKIAIIDSGLGGLDIFKSLITTHPNHHYYYLADNANCPYGTKPSSQISNLTQTIIDYLNQLNFDKIIIACNTMSVHCEEVKAYKILDYNVKSIEKLPQVALIATSATIRSHYFNRLLPFCDIKYINGSILTKHIEEDKIDLINEEIKTLIKLSSSLPILLACTHYGLYKDQFVKLAKQEVIEGKDLLIADLNLINNLSQFIVEIGLTDYNDHYLTLIKKYLGDIAIISHKVELKLV